MISLGLALIAVPIAVWLASRLLEQYSYRISGYGWVFVAAVFLAMVVAFLSILWQTLKAAKTNPATELKKSRLFISKVKHKQNELLQARFRTFVRFIRKRKR
jgi:type VI protein secretion system component VasK